MARRVTNRSDGLAVSGACRRVAEHRPGGVETLGVGWGMVRCPSQYEGLMRRAGGVWELAARQWLVERRRIGPVIHEFEGTSIRCSGASVSTLSRTNKRQSSGDDIRLWGLALRQAGWELVV